MDLEDFCTDIIGKAQKGLKISDTELCSKANIDEKLLNEVKLGSVNSEVIKKIALVLRLNGDALIVSAKRAWSPREVVIEGLRRYESRYNSQRTHNKLADFTVNSYLIWDLKTHESVIADTGLDATEMIKAVKELKIIPKILLLTHSHTDHIAGLEAIRKAFPDLKIVIDKKEIVSGAEGIEAGMRFKVGGLSITTRKTSGHSPGGLTYVIEGLERPIAVVGDSLFAGSMGGAPLAYEEALANNKREILSLAEETIICPGHGPMTTVGEEREHNPFFA